VSTQRPGYSLPLAHGELSQQDAIELQQLKDQIKEDLGFHCDGYKEQCLRRRIAVRMRARGMHTYAEYGQLLHRETAEQHRLLDAVTINVSKFYRNRDLWTALETQLVPQLFQLRDRPVRIWSAGCAAGEEPYTIAMLLRQYAVDNGREHVLGRFDVLGTDIDRASLALAKTGKYGSFAFTEIDEQARDRWFVPPERIEVQPEVRKMVRFEEKDLIKESFDTGFHLIMCRNVIIYFERAVQENLFLKFHNALAPGGILVLGKVETILVARWGCFARSRNASVFS
jgi:chemotaxis methyl-accepting protein methylase